MTEQGTHHSYIFLDTEQERKQLVDEIARVRDELTGIIERMDESDWYEPRYHGWTPAAMLGHLNLMDSLSLLLIKAALVGFKPRFSQRTLNRFNNFMIRLFTRRVVPTSIEGIRAKQARIAEFIQNLPIDRFTRQVYDPDLERFLTIEQALQELFLHHWRDHLQTIREVEGLEQPPEEHSDSA